MYVENEYLIVLQSILTKVFMFLQNNSSCKQLLSFHINGLVQESHTSSPLAITNLSIYILFTKMVNKMFFLQWFELHAAYKVMQTLKFVQYPSKHIIQ